MGYMVRVYLSTVRPGITEDDVRAIVEVSRSRNALARVSGMLLFGSGRFLQLLEGPGPAVDRTYRRVLSDPRHRDVVLIYDGMGEPLRFTDWPMGYARAEQFVHLRSLAPLMGLGQRGEEAKLTSDAALRLLLDLRKESAYPSAAAS
jgi:hypothetical protein